MRGHREELVRLAGHVRPGGHVAAVGAADVEALAARGVDASNVMGLVTTASLAALAGLLEAHEIVVPELHPFPLADAGTALAAVATGHVRGKVVVTVA
jgi:D-arabinose 1-dehydrogenase-like Zn-dependent alcohol dehydrogenase